MRRRRSRHVPIDTSSIETIGEFDANGFMEVRQLLDCFPDKPPTSPPIEPALNRPRRKWELLRTRRNLLVAVGAVGLALGGVGGFAVTSVVEYSTSPHTTLEDYGLETIPSQAAFYRQASPVGQANLMGATVALWCSPSIRGGHGTLHEDTVVAADSYNPGTLIGEIRTFAHYRACPGGSHITVPSEEVAQALNLAPSP